MATPLTAPLKSFVSAGLDFGSSGARISLIRDSDEIYNRSVKYDDYADPAEWISALHTLTSELPTPPAALSISSTSNSLLAVDPSTPTLSPLAVSMYDDAPVLPFDLLQRQQEALQKGELDAVEGVDYQTPFAKTGGATKALALLSSTSVSASLIYPQSSYILHNLLLSSMPFTADWNNLMKLGYDPTAHDYIDAVKNCLGTDATQKLPSGAPTGTYLGTIDTPDTPLKGCAVYLGSTDSICAFIGALSASTQSLSDPSSLEGLTVTSLGTTLATKMLSKRRVYDASRGVYSHLLPANVLFERFSCSAPSTANLWLAGGASQAGCRILRDLEFSPEELAHLSTQIPPDITPTNDLYPLPLNSKGERFPIVDDSKQTNVDPSKYETRLSLLQDVLFGIANNVELEGYKILNELGAPTPSRILTSGGGSNNDQWTVIRSRLINSWLDPDADADSPISVSKAPPSRDAAFGAALIAHRSHNNNTGAASSLIDDTAGFVENCTEPVDTNAGVKTRYWGVELSPSPSDEVLLKILEGTGYGVDDLVRKRLHVTLAFAPKLEQENYWNDRQNVEMKLKVSGVAWDVQAAALYLNPEFKIPLNEGKTPHVTVALKGGASAYHSNVMLAGEHERKDVDLEISGFVTCVVYEN